MSLGCETMDVIKYLWEENRLKTFTCWPYKEDSRCSPSRMAAAGFYACGSVKENDLARCAFCDKELDGWEQDDDPWQEHKKHTRKCIFVKLNKEEAQMTCYEIIDLMEKYFEYLIEKDYKEKTEKAAKVLNNLLDYLQEN